MRRIVSAVSATLCAAGLAVALGGVTAPAAAAELPTPVGTSPQVVVRQPATGTLTAVRVGSHDTYDRVVFQLKGSLPGWDVRYVRTVSADPSGKPVTVAGNAVLRVVLTGVTAHTASGAATATGTSRTPRLAALTQVKPAGDFEGVLTFALGTTDRLDFRVFGLTNPTRVVVDVAHPVVLGFTTNATQFWAGPGGGGDFTLAAIRTAAHPGFDRVVLDLPGATVKPNIGVSYANPMNHYPADTVVATLWTYTHANVNESAIASYAGARTITVHLANLRTITVKGVGTAQLDVLLTGRVSHGYRAFLVPASGMTRLVVDVAR